MEDVVKNSKTFAEAIKKIYGYDNGNNRKKFKILVEQNKIDISHLRSRPEKHERIIKVCPICNKEFTTIKGIKTEKITCSYSCSNSYFRSGSYNPNWKDNNYRIKCFMYHKKECIVCGENKIVAVHHYDENKKNNKIDNLIPLCPTHHQYIHSKYKNEIIEIVEQYRNKFLKEQINQKI